MYVCIFVSLFHKGVCMYVCYRVSLSLSLSLSLSFSDYKSSISLTSFVVVVVSSFSSSTTSSCNSENNIVALWRPAGSPSSSTEGTVRQAPAPGIVFLWPRQIFNFLGVVRTETLALFEYRRRRRRRRRTLRPRVTKTAHFLWRTRRRSKTRSEGDCLKEEEEEEIFGGWRVFF